MPNHHNNKFSTSSKTVAPTKKIAVLDSHGKMRITEGMTAWSLDRKYLWSLQYTQHCQRLSYTLSPTQTRRRALVGHIDFASDLSHTLLC